MAAIREGRSYIEDVPSARVAQLAGPGKLSATTDCGALARCDAVSICVPAPLRKTGDPDISYIVAAADEIARYLHPGMVIVLESTTYPGTTTELILPRPTENGQALQDGKDFFLAFSPERIEPGRIDYTTRNRTEVSGGVTPACLEVAQAYCGQAIEHLVPVSSTEAAELVVESDLVSAEDAAETILAELAARGIVTG